MTLLRTKPAMSVPSLPPILIEPLVRAALIEDLGRAGDITSDSIIPAETMARLALNARQPGIVAGLDLAAMAFRLIDPAVRFETIHPDGSAVVPGDIIARVEGRARGLLTAERVALNFLGHLCGIASATAAITASLLPHKARVTCTRKTLPGLRMVQKYAVRVGGGANHRFGLDDAVLIKDNHIAVAGGIRPAVERVRAAIGHLVKIEIEVDTLDQLREVLSLPVDAVLLDNMTPDELRAAVRLVDGRLITEASGGITPVTAPEVAATGVDLISIGWLTHSATVLDIGLDADR
jgi:nicotinate-nucleotide pyrophosphorylase (carboxylating)